MRKNKDEYYRETFVIPGKTAKGNPKRHTVRAKTKPEFDKKIEEAKRLYGKGISLKQTTVEEWSRRWLKIYKANASQTQKEHYAAKLELDILPVLGDLNMRDVRTSHLQELLNSYEGGKLETVKKIKNAVEQLFEDAETEGLIERNPAVHLELPELTEVVRRPLTDLERAVVYEVAQTHKCGIYVLTMLFCGLRRGECIGLTVGDLDFERLRINITKALGYHGNTNKNIGEITGTKAANMRKKKIKTDEDFGKREVPIPNMLLPFLINQCKGKKLDDILFPKSDGKYATKQTCTWWWHSFKRQCHIIVGAKIYRNQIQIDTSPFDDIITPHYLRHTYGTDLLGARIDQTVRKSFLGHAITDVTERYTKVNDIAFENAVKLLNDYYSTLDFSLQIPNRLS